MPTFLETPRFPDTVSLQFSGGPTYLTSITGTISGREKRNIERNLSKGHWVANMNAKTQSDTDELIAFFHAVKGRGYGFRFKDWSDYTVTGTQGVLTLISGSDYQLYKRYTKGALSTDRIIQKPISPIAIAGGGTYTVDYTTGIVTHTAGPAPTSWTGEFDCVCRFDSDEMQIDVIDHTADSPVYNWGNIGFTEYHYEPD